MSPRTITFLLIATIIGGAGIGYGAATLLGEQDEPTATQGVAATTPTPTESTSAPAPDLTVIDYSDVGDLQAVLVESAADADRLAGAPQDFKDFAVTVVTELIEQNQSSCPDSVIGMGVQRIMPSAGFASGGINACGGFAVVWKRESSGWTEIIGSQEVFSCTSLREHEVPAQVLVDPQCRDESTQQVVAYDG